MQRALALPRTIGIIAAICCLMLAGMFATSCGPDHEQAIRDALTQELDTIKNLDESFVNEIASQEGISDLQEFGIDPNEFITAYLSGFDYTIDEIAVDDETANATVTLSVKSFNEFNNSLSSALEGLLADESLASLSEEDLYARVGQTVMDTINGMQPRQIEPLTITYTLVDNQWTPTAESQTAIDNALMSN